MHFLKSKYFPHFICWFVFENLLASEGRRNHLKTHKNVGWDDENSQKEEKDEKTDLGVGDSKKDVDGDPSENVVQRRKIQLRRSLTRTCSSIVESIKSLF